MSLIGKQGFQLFVDIGEPIDPNLIEVLCQEVLAEKISSMVNKFPTHSDRVDCRPQLNSDQNHKQQWQAPPVPSPRRSLEFLENQREPEPGLNVDTPVATPPLVQSPRVMAPSAKYLPESTASPATQERQQKQQLEQIIHLFQLVNDQDKDDSLLEVTLSENEQGKEKFNSFFNF